MKKTVGTFRTILTITIGFIVLYFIAEQNRVSWITSGKNWWLWIAAGIGGLSALSSYLAEKIVYLWMQLGYVLGHIVPKIVLSVIFFLILFPVALLSRLFSKKDSLQLKNNQDSVFKDVNKTFEKVSFEKPW